MTLAKTIREKARDNPTWEPARIREELLAEGVEADTAYIKLVLRRAKPKKPPKRMRQRTAETVVNRSEAIRAILATHPQKKPVAIQGELAEQGIVVSINLVKVVRYNWRKEQAKKLLATQMETEYATELPLVPSSRRKRKPLESDWKSLSPAEIEQKITEGDPDFLLWFLDNTASLLDEDA